MIEFAVFHNGSTDLPTRFAGPVSIPDGNLSTVHESMQRVVMDQVRQGVLAEKLGFDYWFLTEHHFEVEGAEFSAGPLLLEAAIAAQTSRIRLGQMANIAAWWHPVRLAEQAALLDVVSGGRLEFGLGRGYQSRETEVFGTPYGSTAQDSERNRAYFEEAYELILKAWTQDSFSHRGNFFSIPPPYTTWHHTQTMAFFGEPGAGRTVEDVLQLGHPTGNPVPIYSHNTILKEISVFPQPLQRPHPQVWMPVTSPRSVQWAARNGLNAIFAASTNDRIRPDLEVFYQEAEKHDWPDRLGRGPLKFGWDAEKRRGTALLRFVHVVEEGIGDLDRALTAIMHLWSFLGSFPGALVATPDGTSDGNGEMAKTLDDYGLILFGSKQRVIDGIMEVKDLGGYDDYITLLMFDLPGFTGPEVAAQMEYFSREIMPVLRRECGGSAEPLTSAAAR
jgi:alkanesulfonate monooxygenase SsuD/methylene tetrahydromethanopterin reductase-like flavin-dependent oxidoreductase (luciferase family)